MRAGEAVAAALWTGEALLHGAALSWDGDGRLRAISATRFSAMGRTAGPQ